MVSAPRTVAMMHQVLALDSFFCCSSTVTLLLMPRTLTRATMPGMVHRRIEMMAQASSGLYPEAFDGNLLVYRGMDQVKFRHEVHPGDLCETRATLVEHKGSLFVCETSLSVGGVRCCQARITLAAVPKG